MTDWPELAVVAVTAVVVIVVFGLLSETSASLILICEELCKGFVFATAFNLSSTKAGSELFVVVVAVFVAAVVVVGESCGELLLLLPFAMLLSMLEMNLFSVSLAATEAGLTLAAVDLCAVCCLD